MNQNNGYTAEPLIKGADGLDIKIIGLTGGIGSGKSTVARIMKDKYNSYLIIADDLGHVCMKQGQDCYSRIVEYFGTEILDRNGDIDRDKLSRIVFKDEQALTALNSIIHPCVQALVMEEINRVRREGSCSRIIVESAILIEAGYESVCDEVWYVYAPEAVRRERLRAGRGYTEDKTDRIMRQQLSDGEFRRKCTKVINNSGNTENIMEELEVLLV